MNTIISIFVCASAWVAICALACMAIVGFISTMKPEDNGDYVEPNGK